MDGPHNVGRLAEAVAFVGEFDEGVGNAGAGQRGDHEVGLVRRHYRILGALEYQHRGVEALNVVDGRPFPVDLLVLRPPTDQPIQVSGFELMGVGG